MTDRVEATHYNSLADWHREGIRRFGNNDANWRFVCPVCGYVASVQEWRDLKGDAMIAFSCIGRLLPVCRDAFRGSGPGPCNYAGGGLFKLGPVTIGDREDRYFAFAEAGG